MPVVLIVIGVLLLLALCGSKGKKLGNGAGKGSGAGSEKKSRNDPVRIDRPHYYDADDHECSVCGTRFGGNSMVCPQCGAQFRGTKANEDEFVEEMVVWDDDD